MEAPINKGTCIIQAMIYMHLLTVTSLHNKAAVVTKMLVKSICLHYNSDGLTMGIS